MSAEMRILERMRNRSSRKALILVHLIMLCTCTMFIILMAFRWQQCKAVMDSTGMTLSEIATVEYKSSYTEYEVRGIASFHNGFRLLILLFCVLGGWAAWPFNIKHDREILKLIDNKDVKVDSSSNANN